MISWEDSRALIICLTPKKFFKIKQKSFKSKLNETLGKVSVLTRHGCFDAGPQESRVRAPVDDVCVWTQRLGRSLTRHHSQARAARHYDSRNKLFDKFLKLLKLFCLFFSLTTRVFCKFNINVNSKERSAGCHSKAWLVSQKIFYL